MTSLYHLRSTPARDEFQREREYIVTKLSADYEVESVYALSPSACSCPQSHKPTCRHRKMLPLFLHLRHIDDGWLLDWDTRMWRKPLAEFDPLPLPAPTTLDPAGSPEAEPIMPLASGPPAVEARAAPAGGQLPASTSIKRRKL